MKPQVFESFKAQLTLCMGNNYTTNKNDDQLYVHPKASNIGMNTGRQRLIGVFDFWPMKNYVFIAS